MANSKQINFSIIEILKKILDPIKIIGQELIANKQQQDNRLEAQAKQIEKQESGYISALVNDITNTKAGKRLQQTVRKVENTKETFTQIEIKNKEKEKIQQRDYEITD